MNALFKFLFANDDLPQMVSIAILVMRVVFGILIMSHGFMKVANFSAMEQTFPDPLGVGPQMSLMLAIFAELLCGFAFAIGFLYRIVLIPLMFTMAVIVFIVNGREPFAQKELPFAYLCIFCISYMLGPGRYSVDFIFHKLLFKE